mmetsp:Transcript_27531/g.64553  ORF Transcript_27531/g.64553 Transcript_27531/m.64553 type:complete len:223 (+) Transcript_27531:1898-2566(+)
MVAGLRRGCIRSLLFRAVVRGAASCQLYRGLLARRDHTALGLALFPLEIHDLLVGEDLLVTQGLELALGGVKAFLVTPLDRLELLDPLVCQRVFLHESLDGGEADHRRGLRGPSLAGAIVLVEAGYFPLGVVLEARLHQALGLSLVELHPFRQQTHERFELADLALELVDLHHRIGLARLSGGRAGAAIGSHRRLEARWQTLNRHDRCLSVVGWEGGLGFGR